MTPIYWHSICMTFEVSDTQPTSASDGHESQRSDHVKDHEPDYRRQRKVLI